MKNNCAGNVLFLILIAVALFAALSYAVTGSSRTGDSAITKDKANLLASEIIQYGTTLESAINRMMVIDHVPVEKLDIRVNGYPIQGTNANCAEEKCQLFSPGGGGVSAINLNKAATDPDATSWYKTSNGQSMGYFMIVPVSEVGSDLADLVFIYGGVDDNVCKSINAKLKIVPYTVDLVYDDHEGYDQQHGNLYPYPTPTGMVGDVETRVAGKHAFCIPANSTYGNYYYHVMVAR